MTLLSLDGKDGTNLKRKEKAWNKRMYIHGTNQLSEVRTKMLPTSSSIPKEYPLKSIPI